jgi:hypothetical protein
LNTLTFDFGTFGVGGPTQSQLLSLTNLVTTASFTAGLDLDSIVGSGDTAVLSTNLATFSNLAAGTSSFFDVFFDLSTIGSFSANYTLRLSDQNLAGATNQTLTLMLLGEVVNLTVPEPATLVLGATATLCLGAYRLRSRKRRVRVGLNA